jgi:SAM-dependent methyltransferase
MNTNGDVKRSTNHEAYWDSPESIAEYSAAPFLLRGERLALAACFEGGFAGRPVLDLACGAGRTTYFLQQMGAEVIAVDIAENLIRAARRNFPGIDFRVGDAEFLEFADNSFDAVLFSYNSLDCLYPKEKRLNSLREVWRVLRPNGSFVFSHHNLGALFCGWYRFLRPAKLHYRLTHILNGNAFRPECYLPELGLPEMNMYFAWPRQVIADLMHSGFVTLHIFPNDAILWFLQRSLGTNRLTRLAEPWPYYVCRKLAASTARSGQSLAG